MLFVKARRKKNVHLMMVSHSHMAILGVCRKGAAKEAEKMRPLNEAKENFNFYATQPNVILKLHVSMSNGGNTF
jgi:ABC-type polysaccharide/polyol phosphate transport system ATPase subunit